MIASHGRAKMSAALTFNIISPRKPPTAWSTARIYCQCSPTLLGTVELVQPPGQPCEREVWSNLTSYAWGQDTQTDLPRRTVCGLKAVLPRNLYCGWKPKAPLSNLQEFEVFISSFHLLVGPLDTDGTLAASNILQEVSIGAVQGDMPQQTAITACCGSLSKKNLRRYVIPVNIVNIKNSNQSLSMPWKSPRATKPSHGVKAISTYRLSKVRHVCRSMPCWGLNSVKQDLPVNMWHDKKLIH